MGSLALSDDILKKSVKDHLLDEMSSYKSRMGFKSEWQMIAHLEKKSKISKPTIHRAMNDDKTFPTPQTLYNLYTSMYETTKYEEIVSKVPEEVAEYFKRYLLKSSCGEVYDSSIEEYLLRDQLALRIYNECAGAGSTIEKIQQKFGEFGINEMNKLKNMNVLKIEKNIVKLGKVRINATPSNVQKQLLFNIEKYYRPFHSNRKFENFLYSRIENTSPETYREILIDVTKLWESVSRKLENESLTKRDSELTVKFCFGGIFDKISE